MPENGEAPPSSPPPEKAELLPSPSIDEASTEPAPITPEDPASGPLLNTQELLDHATRFLSTASAETLAATAVGGSVILVLVFGKLALLVVGVVVGAVGHASLSLATSKQGHSSILERWQERIKSREDSDDDSEKRITKSRTPRRVDFSSLPPETAKAMEELANAVLRDYVRWWYSPLLPKDDNFPNSCENVLRSALLSIHDHLNRKRSADTFMMFLVSTTNTLIVFFRELAAVAQSSIGTYIEESPSAALAQMLDSDLQRRKLRMAADDIVQSFLGKEVLECDPARIFLTEILAGLVLDMTVAKCSDPDWINSWLVYLLDEETQPEILQKIDIGEATETDGKTHEERMKAKRISRAEDEMKRAMEEAAELSRMIAEEEERKSSESGRSTSIDMTPARAVSMPPPSREAPPPLHRDSLPAKSIEQQRREPALTSFDQIVAQVPTSPPQAERSQDILHRAHITLDDLSPPNGNAPERPLRSKPGSAMYLVQIEPSTSAVPGWLLTRKYTDFETLHEVLRRIAMVSGVESFTKMYPDIPTWRGETPDALRSALERYLNVALKERALAESEGMKRFLEKDAQLVKSGGGAFGALGKWPNPNTFAKMGQGALDVLTKAPQGVAQGGKGLFGGMKRAFGPNLSSPESNGRNGTRSASPGRTMSIDAGYRSSIDTSYRPDSAGSSFRQEENGVNRSRNVSIAESSPQLSRQSSHYNIQLELPPSSSEDEKEPATVERVLSLPPPPSDMPDDYGFSPTTPPITNPLPDSTLSPGSKQDAKKADPLSTQETQFIVEILFALLSELYTLSSAWTLRRSLLNVAKSILLRPGNASLEDIRVLLQETVIDANTSDEAIAGHIRKLREACFPTAEETAKWEEEQKRNPPVQGEELREKARYLVKRKGVPEALRGVMGAVATEEALGAVFDAMQDVPVGRGVMGGLVLEGVRGFCQ